MVEFPCAGRALHSESKVCCIASLENEKKKITYYACWYNYYRMVHAFTCAGMLPSQYTHLSMFSGIGVVGHAYIHRDYLTHGWQSMYTYLLSTFSVSKARVH